MPDPLPLYLHVFCITIPSHSAESVATYVTTYNWYKTVYFSILHAFFIISIDKVDKGDGSNCKPIVVVLLGLYKNNGMASYVTIDLLLPVSKKTFHSAVSKKTFYSSAIAAIAAAAIALFL